MAKLKRILHNHGGWSKRGAVWLVVLVVALLLTGILIHGQDEGAGMEWSEWQARWHRGAAVVHGMFAWVFCVVAGRWAWPHVAIVWQRRSDGWIWGLGLTVALLGGLAGVTGLGLLYGSADWRGPLSWLHWWVGLLWPALIAAHAWKWIAKALGYRL